MSPGDAARTETAAYVKPLGTKAILPLTYCSVPHAVPNLPGMLGVWHKQVPKNTPFHAYSMSANATVSLKQRWASKCFAKTMQMPIPAVPSRHL